MIKKSNKIILSVMVLTLCLATVPMFSMNDENGNCENKKSLVDLATPTAMQQVNIIVIDPVFQHQLKRNIVIYI
jgi:hypothetical protein